MDAKVGAGGGDGVHICTGPARIEGSEPGDILEVRIVDVASRPSANPACKASASLDASQLRSTGLLH